MVIIDFLHGTVIDNFEASSMLSFLSFPSSLIDLRPFSSIERRSLRVRPPEI